MMSGTVARKSVAEMTDAEMLAELADIKRALVRDGQSLLRGATEVQDVLNRASGKPHCIRFYGEAGQLKSDGGNAVSGYATRWGVRDQHNDVVERGAFSKSLGEHRAAGTRPLMLWQHNADEVVGVWHEATEDSTGLFVSGSLLPNVRRAAEAAELIRAGAIRGLSVGINILRSSREASVRRLEELVLKEVSLVSFPCLSSALLTTKSAEPQQSALALFHNAADVAADTLTSDECDLKLKDRALHALALAAADASRETGNARLKQALAHFARTSTLAGLSLDKGNKELTRKAMNLFAAAMHDVQSAMLVQE